MFSDCQHIGPQINGNVALFMERYLQRARKDFKRNIASAEKCSSPVKVKEEVLDDGAY